MSSSDLKRLEELFHECRSVPVEDRPRFLEAACGGDEQLRTQVEILLAASGNAPDITGMVVRAVDDMRQQSKPWAGRMAGAYRIVREIGHGGMGAVYLAERADGAFEKSVAVKVLQWSMANSALAERFRQERQILAGLDHPNIARLLDGGVTEDGLPFLVMDYVDGEPLLDWCKEKPLHERIQLFQQICSAAQYAHQHLVVHRDLKPDNILVDKSGTPKLLDFGIAKIVSEQMQDSADGSTSVFRPFTPRYSSPEQVDGRPVSTVTDVYGLGMILYEMLTGVPAQRLTSTQYEELHRVVCTVDPPKPSAAASSRKLADELTGDLDAIIMKALRKEPAARYGSVEQLSDDIRRYLQHVPVLARRSTFRYRAGRFLRRRRGAVIAGSTALLALILFALAMTVQARRIAHERDHAERERNKADQTAKFLESLFTDASPDVAKGKQITLRETLDRGAERVKTELAGQPEVQAHMMLVLGNVYGSLDLYDQALDQLKESLRIQQEVLHLPEVDQATTKSDLAGVYGDTGNLVESERLLREVVGLREQLVKRNPRPLISSLEGLGAIQGIKGDPAAAEPLLREAIEVYRQPNVEHTHDVQLAFADTLTVHANALVDLKRYTEAETEVNEALDIFRRTEGEQYPNALNTMYLMAKLRNAMGDHDGAIEWSRKVVALSIKVNGEMNRQTAADMNDLGGYLKQYGDISEAEALVRRALDIYSKVFPEGHYLIGQAKVNLGDILLRRGEPRQAEPVLREAVQILTKTLPQGHRSREFAEEALGSCLVQLKRYSEAYPYLSRACPATIQNHGADSFRAVRCQKALAETNAVLHKQRAGSSTAIR
ncbi:MAG: serine/threonine-protein kinase [Acidobacteriaceae bacterium]|nr:serine/threonine-protein kinase [Acidobacteriaceae bacterium]